MALAKGSKKRSAAWHQKDILGYYFPSQPHATDNGTLTTQVSPGVATSAAPIPSKKPRLQRHNQFPTLTGSSIGNDACPQTRSPLVCASNVSEQTQRTPTSSGNAHNFISVQGLRFQRSQLRYPRPSVPCGHCGKPMVLRAGQVRRPHFAHVTASVSCGSNGESEVHKFAKQVLVTWMNTRIPLTVSRACCCDKTTILLRSDERAVSEVLLPNGGRADVAVMSQGDIWPKAVVEVRHRHKTLADSRRDTTWYELNAADILAQWEMDPREVNLTCVNSCASCSAQRQEEKDFSLRYHCKRKEVACEYHALTGRWKLLMEADILSVPRSYGLPLHHIVQVVEDQGCIGPFYIEFPWSLPRNLREFAKEDPNNFKAYKSAWVELQQEGECVMCHDACSVYPGRAYCVSCYTKVMKAYEVGESLKMRIDVKVARFIQQVSSEFSSARSQQTTDVLATDARVDIDQSNAIDFFYAWVSQSNPHPDGCKPPHSFCSRGCMSEWHRFMRDRCGELLG